MTTQEKQSFVIGISSVSGGGKTVVTRRLAQLLQDSVTLCFDDYDDTNLHPENRRYG
jgi:uridine kinase